MKKLLKSIVIAATVLSCGVSSAADNAPWPPQNMTQLPPDYLERLHAGLAATAGRIDRVKDGKESIGYVRYGMAALLLNQRVDEINKFFESDKFVVTANPKFGFSLFGVSYVRLYGLMNSHTGTMKGRLTPAAQANFEKGFWQVAKANSRLSEANRHPWEAEGSENHHLASKTCDFLVAQYLRKVPEYAHQQLDDGSTLDQQYGARRAYWMKWFDERAKRGQFTEAGSPSYQGDSVNALFNVRDFAEDPILRKKADMYLDYVFANIAEETLLNSRGGPKSRVKKGHEYDAGGVQDRAYDVLFDAPGRQYVALGDTTRATSDYYPPPAIVNLAKDITGRGAYSFIKRWPGPVADGGGRGYFDEDGEGKSLWRRLDPERSVLRAGFATPNYVIGSATIDPSWTDDASGGHRWQGIVYRTNVYARVGMELIPPKEEGWHGFNSFTNVQDRNLLVTQGWNPVPPNPKSSDPAYLAVYFSPTLDDVQDEGGWIFVKAGDAYTAVKVVTGGYKWKPAWKRDTTLSNNNKAFIVLDTVDSPIITIANDAADYDNDFNKFKEAIKRQPVQFNNGVLQFATIKFSGRKQPPQINGKNLNLAPPRVNDSAFIRSEWGSGLIYIRKGDDTLTLDFRDSNNPVKTVGAPVTPAYPPGVGQDKPIVFGMN